MSKQLLIALLLFTLGLAPWGDVLDPNESHGLAEDDGQLRAASDGTPPPP